MKFQSEVSVILAAFVAICTSSAIPSIPGDNSHYVEGKSRYIWMPDGNEVPQLVDLFAEDPRTSRTTNGSSNAYWLFTRSNPTTAEYLVYQNETTVQNSNFTYGLPIRVIAHGWNNDGSSTVNTMLTEAFLTMEDVNVIVLDWSDLASSFYTTAAAGVPSVGEYLGNFLEWLLDLTGGSWDDMHMVGHSLGAHVVGNAGRVVNGSVARITGMDPAGPTWGDNADALNTSSAQYVETINTDGGVLGIFDPIGHANFYPNGGRNPQPGCLLSTCSHSRSYELMAATIYHNHKIGLSCTDLDEADDNKCTGTRLYMGYIDVPKNGSGYFSLSTGENWPY